ncbi:MAG: hypothetical protein HOP33_13530 [Verrucomicrobia bacterium]|nr:hypothetical protein [Verrucomicrobiota bacterium]
MKSNSINSHTVRSAGFIRNVIAFAFLAMVSTLKAQTYYDFDNGTDAGWTRPTVHPSTITYPSDALGGHAYRLQGTPLGSGVDPNSRVFSYITNRAYTNFYAAVDVVAWNTNQDSDMVIGLIARANGNDGTFPPTSYLNTSDPLFASFNPDIPNGLTFNVRLHNQRSYSGPGNTGPLGSADQMSIWSINNNIFNPPGSLTLGNPVAVTQSRFRWVAGHAYRLVFSCTNNYAATPSFFSCSIYDVNDLTKPLLSMAGDDTYNGNFDQIPRYGYVGVFAFKLDNGDFDPNVDATFDNFYVGETAPVTAVVVPAIPHGKLGAPQVINRVPASFKNFHPAASGITFNATTLTTTNNVNTSVTKLFLNGVDVSAGLVISGPATNASVSYSGLTTNVIYNARIELSDTLGRSTTNEWTFDTFSDAYLASASVKVIEAEDYDFGGGGFINDPPASGFAGYDAINDTGTIINSGSGYVDQTGTPGGVDFFDRDNSSHSLENQYRHADAVGTQQGNCVTYAFGDVTQTVLPYGISQSYDNQRSKYSSLSPTLQEYILERTEGGEWMNYTRIFDGSKTYNVFLRAAGSLAQPVRLDQIGATTNTLGSFNVPSTFFVDNYRYTPLVTTNGDLALVKLNGQSTVRLTIDSLQNNGSRGGLSLNYVALVPAAPQLYSSATVNGNFTPELNVLVDAGNKKITVPRNGATRYYRIGWSSQITISGLSFSGPNVVLTYQ